MSMRECSCDPAISFRVQHGHDRDCYVTIASTIEAKDTSSTYFCICRNTTHSLILGSTRGAWYKPLYELAKCKDKFFSVRKTMKTVHGDEYVMDGVGKVIAAHRQMRITKNGKPCVHAMEKNLGIFSGNQWEIKIGPGIDPSLIVAFMAIMDEMNEKND